MSVNSFHRHHTVSALALLLTSCTMSTPGSKPLHQAQAPHREKGLWAQPNEALARAYLESQGETSLLPASHELSRRLNDWTQALDAAFRRSSPGMENVPVPQVFVARTPELNASAKNINVCFPTKGLFRNAVPGNSTLAAKYLHFSPRQNRLTHGDNAPCLDAAQVGLTLADVVSTYSRSADTSVCALSQEGGTLVFSGTCNMVTQGNVSSENIVISLSSNIIVVKGGLIKEVDEDLAIAAVAHEMGHIYRAHVSRPANQQGHFYVQNPENNGDAEPVATQDPHLISMAKELQTQTLLRESGFDGQKFHHQVLGTILSSNFDLKRSLGRICNVRCDEACSDLFDDLRSPETLRVVRRGDFSSSSNRNLYTRVEKSFSRCAREAPVTSGSAPNAIASSELASAVGGKEWSDALRDDLKKDDPKDLLDAATVMTKTMDLIQKRQTQLHQDAIRERLGWYSIEQEADDVAVELLAGVHIDPRAFQELMFLLLKKADGAELGDALNFTACRRAFNAYWKNESGENIFVPVGLWSDIHHSHCYRIFNTDREVRGHDWNTNPRLRPQFAGQSWNDLRSAAGLLH